MTSNGSESIETLLVSASRLIRQAARATGNPMSAGVWTALSVLDTEGPHRTGDLARAARISQPGMTKVVQNLVVDEWVRRIADTDDSRAWLIVITERGRTALARWRRELAETTDQMFADLSESQRATLAAAAEILAAQVAKQEEAA
jgi:DNA-binding MarR family transcriptional regulator